jgi:hypothetical protein
MEVTASIERLSGGASETGRAAGAVLGASRQLGTEAVRLRGAVDSFLVEARKIV